jgi:hypothetical protein
MNIIKAAKFLKQGKTVEQNEFELIPSVGGFLNLKHARTEEIPSILKIGDLLSDKWTVLEEK